jgi:hypothetical protein
MGSEKTTYWIAVGVLAVVIGTNFGSNFAARHADGVRCLADRSLAAVERISGQGTRLMATAEMMLGRGEIRFARTQTTLARAQTRLASVQTAVACREAAFARIQAEQARVEAMQQLHGMVICPRPNLRIVMPEPPLMQTDGTI